MPAAREEWPARPDWLRLRTRGRQHRWSARQPASRRDRLHLSSPTARASLPPRCGRGGDGVMSTFRDHFI
eukprot:SM000065S20263  [mRNA]  locus=s65:608618:610049:- [translate_table: standard]